MAQENTAEQEPTTVLVADDDPEILSLVSAQVRRLGAHVIEASDGDEALSTAKERLPSVVILDVMMPGMSGWEVCRALREHTDTQSVKVLMLTAIGERLNEMTSPLYGADAYLDKPFEFDALQAKVRELIDAARAA